MARDVPDSSVVTTFLFTDIGNSTRLWEQDAGRMGPALACHDALSRSVVEAHHGVVVKMTGDGIHAAFDDPLDAIAATVDLQQALDDPAATHGVALRVRCGVHAGSVERRDNDYFGGAVNRAARIMSAASPGQILVSQAVATLVEGRLSDGSVLRDLGPVRLRDLARPERLYQVTHPALRVDFPALRSLEATPNNLPQQVTSFIGRERESAEVTALLTASRLVTLLGVGGIGKSRLSLQVAADRQDDYPDGVWLVELGSVTDAGLVPLAVAAVLGIKEEAGRPVTEALLKHVRDRHALIILDNCEHVVGACADLAAQLLRASPVLKIFASSREALRIRGEATYSVPALAVPDPDGVEPAALAHYESVRLFVDRALAASHSFRVTPQNAAAVTEICRRLDGIPLALELAAARVRALSVENIAARLGDRLRLLGDGDRTALPRQQTLRALIDWSYDLLTPDEQILFRRLAVFAGGFTLEAAEEVAAGGALSAADVLGPLTRLVEKSLVTLEGEGLRYRLLETVRQYARERLAESGEEGDARERHFAWYLALAEKARPELVGAAQGVWLARLDQERENLLSAHAWCDRTEAPGISGLRLVSAVRRYWMIRGLLGLGHRVTVEALARPAAQARTAQRCDALFDAGQIGSWMGRYEEARSYLGDCLAIARELGDRRRIEAVLQPLAVTSLGLGDFVNARTYLEEALALARELGNRRETAAALNALAQINRAEGKLETAEQLYGEALAVAREIQDRESICIALLNLAMVCVGRDALEQARTMLIEVLTTAQEIGLKPAGASLLEVSAGLSATRGEHDRAALFFGAAEAQTGQTGLHRDAADEAFLAPLIARARESLGAAAFQSAEAAGRAMSYDDALASVRAWLERGA
jgi:predicted ATPase/class 3 adenylate cyclase